MVKENDKLEIRNKVTKKDRKILIKALAGIKGWNFNPIAVITNDMEDYYFICRVKTIVENLQMQMARIYIKVTEGSKPRLLAIEEIV
ncbi:MULTISPECIES: hypothetical protein [Clostridium]|jgi:hypothetical protein|uniref:Uncharacterized protein n=1 Tax=Clostridium saccharoperbutylacetonicum N1-4(HMT) TaxID=931276 RepID=M1MI39_9CLOT|nr:MULTISPECIES: hypothetical protein [Clostridium]AGF57594.1 hypothetical protein Cspa_c38340 [Clostridium saccharoperbutylacetonicum N1-4(HMT)]AQR96287.1 hypothetical protein CLSAP_36080 [Clostridium saccharoperbutylacetonicum]NRT61638.1 hypothetical protein [Clostridium saccharoperbutylacetonicum]NSB24961.1 hypothetical protein [Clostridium saccharoperbutylacetonicum]NSB32160.1 hypothetical protein [Clostridium saccharoperbutylacetonicum]